MAGTNLQFNATVSAAQINQWLRELETGTTDAARKINSALGGEVKKVLTIEYKTDESGLRRAVAVEKERLTALDQIQNKVNQLNRIERGSVVSLQQQVKEAAQARNQIARLKEATDAYGNSVRLVNPAWTEANNRLQAVKKELDQAGASNFWQKIKSDFNLGGLISFTNGLVQVTQGLQAASIVIGQITGAINTLVNALAGLQQFRLAFEAVGAGASGATQALGESSRIALGLGVSLSTVRQGFQQLTPVVLNSGGTIGDVSKIVESLSSRFAAFGISGDRARRVMNGVIQAFAKGKLQAEELTQQISEADPAFKTDLAKAIGVSVQELEKFVKNGQITSEVLLEALPKLSKSSLLFGKLGTSAADAARVLGSSNVTIDQVRNQFDSLNQLSLERLAKQFEPLINAFFRLQAVFVDFFSNISKLESVKTIGLALAGIVDASSGVIAAILSLTEAFLSIVNVIAPFVNSLLEIPGVSQAIGLIILSRLIPPLNTLKTTLLGLAGPQVVQGITAVGQAFGQAAGSGSRLAQVLAKLNTFKGFQQIFAGPSRLDSFKALSAEVAQLGTRSTATKARLDQLSSGLGAARSKALAAKGALGANSAAAIAAEVSASRLSRNVDRLNRLYGAQQQRLVGLNAQKSALKGNLLGGAQATGVLTKATNLGRGALNGLGVALGGAIRFLGPLGLALSGVSIVMAAYGNANKDINKISEETKTRTDAVKQAIEQLNPKIAAQEKPVTGLSLAWERFSLITADSVDLIGGGLKNIGNSFGPIGRAIKQTVSTLPPLVQGLGNIAAGAAASAAAGFALGSAFAGIGAGPGAVIGAIAGALVGLAASGDGTEVSFRKFERTLKKSTESVAAQSQGIQTLVKALETSQKRIESNEQALKKLNAERENLVSGGAPQEQIQQKDVQIANVKAQIQLDTTQAQGAINVLRDSLDKLKVDVAALSNRKIAIEAALKDPNTPKEQIAGLKRELRLVSTELTIQQAAANKAGTAVDTFAAKNGFLSEKLRALVPSAANLNNEIKALQETLATDVDLFSADASGAIQQIQNLSAIRDAASRTSAELVRTLRQDALQQELNDIQTASSERIARLNEERNQVREIADERIAALRELGPAERALEQQRRRELERRAAAGDLEAKAQLERLNRNQLIAAIEKRAKEEEKRINREIQAEEKAAREESLAIQRELLALSREEKQASLDAAKAVLEQRGELPNDLKNATAAAGPLLDQMKQIAARSGEFQKAAEAAGTEVPKAGTGATALQIGTSNAEKPMQNVASSASTFNKQVTNGVNKLASLDGKTINVKISTSPKGLWTGGPATGGQVYKVNELGQEGFLSGSGLLRPINKPKNGLWRAPSNGTVIPAHIMSSIAVPPSGVSIGAAPAASVGRSNNFGRVIRALQVAIASSRPTVTGIDELAAVQAHQAQQIGKLGRAIKSLADKDMKVNVNVRQDRNRGYPYGPSLG